MNKLAILCVIFFIFTGCGEQPVDVEQTAEPTAVPTPVPTEFVPAPLEPAELTQEQWEKMKQTTAFMTAEGEVEEKISAKSYPLGYVDYYGTYGGYTAIRIFGYNNWNIHIPVTGQEEGAGYTLYYSGSSNNVYCRVLLWKDNTFYHLQYAYDQGLITAEDVKTIAYYNNLRHFEPVVSASPMPDGSTPVPTEFIPAPIEPAELSEDVWARIRKSYQYVARGEFWKLFTLEHYTNPNDFHYYGTYQGYIALYIVTYSPYCWKQADEEIGGIHIRLGGNSDWLHGRIYLWKEDVFYQLKDAYNMGLISRDDLKSIAYYHNNYKY